MMRVWMVLFWAATVLPLAGMFLALWPALLSQWKVSPSRLRLVLVALWLAGGAFLLARPHDDCFTGLDDMTYRHLAHAFLGGRGFHDADVVLDQVPPALRECFLLHRGPVGRPTRDRVFQLSDWREVQTRPFFMPTLPLAAAAQAPILAPERFVPLVGTIWWALILAAAFIAGGGGGLCVAGALVLGTAWPAYFLRGFYTEAPGAILLSAAIAVAAVRTPRGPWAVAAAFAIGLSLSYHPILIALAVPVGLIYLAENRGRTLAAVGLGLLAGIFPFWALTRWVCQPYGDWTRWDKLATLISLSPEHRAIAVVVGGLALISLAAVAALFHPAVRNVLRHLDRRAIPFGWLLLAVAPLLVMAVGPGKTGETLRTGAVTTWSGLRWPFAVLLLVGSSLILNRARPFRERFWLLALLGASLLFFFIKGTEIPVGLWSQRRFLPAILVAVGLLTAPLSTWLARHPRRQWLAALGLLWAGGANLARWPIAYSVVNEQGASAWVRSVSERIGTNRWVVFDYYAHSVPYAASLEHRVLGLNESSWAYWPEVAQWLQSVVPEQEVWAATSYSPTVLEDGMKLELAFHSVGRFPSVKTKAFFPAERGWRTVTNTFFQLVPVVETERLCQWKILDGSPIGLRGPWGRRRGEGMWSRQGSGIIGPLPPPGGSVDVEIAARWHPPAPDWPTQTLQILPPWDGTPLTLEIAADSGPVRGRLMRPWEDIPRPATGSYRLAVTRPYDPAQSGLRGYDKDLGVLVRRIMIRIEPDAPPVSD